MAEVFAAVLVADEQRRALGAGRARRPQRLLLLRIFAARFGRGVEAASAEVGAQVVPARRRAGLAAAVGGHELGIEAAAAAAGGPAAGGAAAGGAAARSSAPCR